MLRTLVAFVIFVLATLLGSLLAILIGAVDRSGEGVLALGRIWARVALRGAGARLEVHSRAELRRGRPYVFMANHLSTVDIWAVLVALPVSFRFIAKKQLGAIPLFGWAMRAGRFIFIDRHNPAVARRSIEEAARRIEQGQSVVIFPEGTRSRDGRLAPFKKGGFHLALSSGVDIVPVAIRGSDRVWAPGTLAMHPGTVLVQIDQPISTAGLTNGDRDALVERVRDRIAAMLNQDPADNGDQAAASTSPARG
jgi:1-acyl-sn-glycerol-3-phosphate acyltransferase